MRGVVRRVAYMELWVGVDFDHGEPGGARGRSVMVMVVLGRRYCRDRRCMVVDGRWC